MNIVGEDLEKNGYEFLGVNSEITKNPQFVALKGGKLHFVIVRAIDYPYDPKEFEPSFFEHIKKHALKFNARTFYAGVGIANSVDYEKPVEHDEDYIVNYNGWQEL